MVNKKISLVFSSLVLLSCFFSNQVSASGVWVQQTGSPSDAWRTIASSADGTKLVAATYYGGSIYTSSDGGINWIQRTDAGIHAWGSVSSSADGTKLAAVYNGGSIQTSNDSGATWTVQAGSPAANWDCITSSSDGSKLAAAISGGYIYTSINGGANWTQQTNSGSRAWDSIASSSDGVKLVAVNNVGYVYTSTDSGANWTQQTNSGSRAWKYVTSSSDGTKLAAVVNGGYVYTSTDSGANWTQQTNSGSRAWNSIASSSDGTSLAAVVYGGGYIYISTDSGVNWGSQTDPGSSNNWYAISSSSDGSKLAAAQFSGYIYTYGPITIPQMTPMVATVSNSTTVILNAASSGSNTEHGFEYGIDGSYGTTVSQTGTFSAGSFSSTISSVVPNVVYHYRSYAINSAGTGYSVNGTFVIKEFSQQTNSGSRAWKYVTSSSDGTKLAAVVNNDYIYTSTDSGANWTQQTNSGSRAWQSIASSSDGTKLAAVENNVGYVYTSIDGGNNWVRRDLSGTHDFRAIASSFDGTKLVAVSFGGDYIYTSGDSGATWNQRTGPGSRSWGSVASSSDGVNLAAGNSGYSDYIYTSSDSGATWAQRSSAGSQAWNSIASSSDGTKLFATVDGGYLYISVDSGLTWTQQTSSGLRAWQSAASSSDGGKLAAAVNGGYVYAYNPPSVPLLTTGSSSSITKTTVTLGGTITSIERASVTVRGFNYGLTASYGSDTVASGTFGTGAYTANLSSLTCGTTYHYRAYATNSAGTGYGSDQTFSTSACPPSAPSNLSSSNVTTTSLTVSWDAVAGADGYDVYRGGTKVSGGTPFTGTSFADSGLSLGTSYSYAVRTIKGADESADSDALVVSTLNLTSASGLAVGSPTTSSLTLSWTAGTGADSHDVYRDGVLVANVAMPTLTYLDSGLAAASSHAYYVVAKNGASAAAASSSVTASASGAVASVVPSVPLSSGGGGGGGSSSVAAPSAPAANAAPASRDIYALPVSQLTPVELARLKAEYRALPPTQCLSAWTGTEYFAATSLNQASAIERYNDDGSALRLTFSRDMPFSLQVSMKPVSQDVINDCNVGLKTKTNESVVSGLVYNVAMRRADNGLVIHDLSSYPVKVEIVPNAAQWETIRSKAVNFGQLDNDSRSWNKAGSTPVIDQVNKVVRFTVTRL